VAENELGSLSLLELLASSPLTFSNYNTTLLLVFENELGSLSPLELLALPLTFSDYNTTLLPAYEHLSSRSTYVLRLQRTFTAITK
jgi:hypothetical protein